MAESFNQIEAIEPVAHYDYFVSRGLRPDGRGLEVVRPISLALHPLDGKTTVGSALAIIGSTRVIASTSLQIGTPDLAAPTHGDFGELLRSEGWGFGG